MGAQLLQSHWPMAFSIKACQAQRDCAQMEGELLAVFFGMEQSYQFMFWHGMDKRPDQSPSESIMQNSQSDRNYVSESSVLQGKDKVLRREIMVN